MLSEEIGITIKQTLGPLVDVRDVAILTKDEFSSEVTPPEWFDDTSDSYVIKLKLIEQPDKNVIKHISDICFHTRTQVFPYKMDETVLTVYICPTENEFTAMYTLLGEPNPSKLL